MLYERKRFVAVEQTLELLQDLVVIEGCTL